MFVRNEPDLLDPGVDGSLKGAVEPLGFRSQFGCVGDFGFDGDLELVGGISRCLVYMTGGKVLFQMRKSFISRCPGKVDMNLSYPEP